MAARLHLLELVRGVVEHTGALGLVAPRGRGGVSTSTCYLDMYMYWSMPVIYVIYYDTCAINDKHHTYEV